MSLCATDWSPLASIATVGVCCCGAAFMVACGASRLQRTLCHSQVPPPLGECLPHAFSPPARVRSPWILGPASQISRQSSTGSCTRRIHGATAQSTELRQAATQGVLGELMCLAVHRAYTTYSLVVNKGICLSLPTGHRLQTSEFLGRTKIPGGAHNRVQTPAVPAGQHQLSASLPDSVFAFVLGLWASSWQELHRPECAARETFSI